MQQWMYLVAAVGALVAALYYARTISTLLSGPSGDASERAAARAEELLEKHERRGPSDEDGGDDEAGRPIDEADR
jgi:hypothetical protein